MIIALRRRLRPTEDGFTLIELSVAMFITLLVLAALAGSFIGSLSGVALAKQRQAATGLATGVMEQLRATDYGTLSAGMTCSDLVGDPRVSLSGACASGVTGTFTPGIASISEPLVLQVSGPAAAPIVPHLQPVAATKVENVTYAVSTYISKPSLTATSFNLTALVSWTSSVSKGSKTVIQRSVAYSPSRCLSSATHPYGGACQAAFNGDSGLTKAGITVLNADDGTSTIPGLNGNKVDLTLNGVSSTLSAEQITNLTAVASTTDADAYPTTGHTSNGGASTSVAADTDPSSAAASTSSGTVSQPSASPVSLSGTGGVLSLVPSAGDAGSLFSTAASTASSCTDAAGSVLAVLNQPCSWGAVQATGSSSVLNLALPSGAPNFTLASIASSPSPSRSVVARVGASGGSACPTASGVGCLTAQAARTLGLVSLGGLPTAKSGDAPPANWTGSLITVSGLQESAYSEAGLGARSPSFRRTAGTLTYYDAATATVKTLTNFTTLPSNFSANLGTATGTYTLGGQTALISLSGTMVVGAAAPLPNAANADPTCKLSACLSTATPASTLTATLVYNIAAGSQVIRFAVTVDLGAVLARSSYKAAFDA